MGWVEWVRRLSFCGCFSYISRVFVLVYNWAVLLVWLGCFCCFWSGLTKDITGPSKFCFSFWRYFCWVIPRYIMDCFLVEWNQPKPSRINLKGSTRVVTSITKLEHQVVGSSNYDIGVCKLVCDCPLACLVVTVFASRYIPLCIGLPHCPITRPRMSRPAAKMESNRRWAGGTQSSSFKVLVSCVFWLFGIFLV